MTDPAKLLSESHDVSAKVAQVLQTRTRLASEHFSERVRKACDTKGLGLTANPMLPWEIAAGTAEYVVDFAQRSVLLWDTLRRCCRTSTTKW